MLLSDKAYRIQQGKFHLNDSAVVANFAKV